MSWFPRMSQYLSGRMVVSVFLISYSQVNLNQLNGNIKGSSVILHKTVQFLIFKSDVLVSLLDDQLSQIFILAVEFSAYLWNDVWCKDRGVTPYSQADCWLGAPRG